MNSLNIREPLLWEMLGSRKRRSVLVNWYLSFPPQPLLGVNVSDYFPLSVLGRSALRGKHLLQSVFPPGRANEFEAWAEKDYGRILNKLALPDFPAMYEQRATGAHYTDFPILKGYPDMVLQEGIVTTTASHLFRSEEFDLFATYHKLADEVQHFAFMSFIDDAYKEKLARSVVNGELPAAAAKDAYARVADILCPVYQYFEQIMRDCFKAAGDRETYFIIVSDHGFSFFVRDGTVRYNHVGPEKSPDGILIVRGPGVKPGKVKLARIYDIAPTVLYLLGLPLDHSMDGDALRRLFTFHRKTEYTTYRKGKARVLDTNREADEKKLEELKALGYIN
jgi:hypothetical protein